MNPKKNFANWIAKHPKLWVGSLSTTNILRSFTGPVRVLPNFIIIGVAKAGTTSLYENLIKHSSIYPALGKEHFLL